MKIGSKMTSSNQLKQVVSLIKKRIRFHRKALDRYRDEVKTEVDKIQGSTISKKSFSQLQYSDKRSYEELAVIDELELILKNLDSSTTLKRRVFSKQRL